MIFRIMHWAIALCIVLLLITIFLRMYWMNKDHVAGIINTNLTALGISLTHDQLIVLAKQIRKPMWDWHIYIGYVLIGLYSIRMILPFFGEMKFRNPLYKQATAKENFESWTYIFFYVFLAASLVTGFLIVNGPKSIKNQVEDVHVLSIYYILTFIFLHFSGILLAEFGPQKGIISKMISGEKPDAKS